MQCGRKGGTVRQQIDGLTSRRSRPKSQQHLTALEKQQAPVVQGKQQAKGKNQAAAAEKKHPAASTNRRAAEEEVIAQQEQIRLAKKLALAGEDTEGRETLIVGK